MDIHELMDLKVDYAFKQLFGHQKNIRVLITFLNSILNGYTTESYHSGTIGKHGTVT